MKINLYGEETEELNRASKALTETDDDCFYYGFKYTPDGSIKFLVSNEFTTPVYTAEGITKASVFKTPLRVLYADPTAGICKQIGDHILMLTTYDYDNAMVSMMKDYNLLLEKHKRTLYKPHDKQLWWNVEDCKEATEENRRSELPTEDEFIALERIIIDTPNELAERTGDVTVRAAYLVLKDFVVTSIAAYH